MTGVNLSSMPYVNHIIADKSPHEKLNIDIPSTFCVRHVSTTCGTKIDDDKTAATYPSASMACIE